MCIDGHVKLHNFSRGVKLAGGSLGDGKTTTCTSQKDCGAFSLSQLGNPESQ
jgi:hypothetical protein